MGAITTAGELYTWGSNIGGCAAHSAWRQFVSEPTLVKALYIEPTNLALGKLTAQSSVYNGLGPSTAVNGNRSGNGTKFITHTQSDAQAWWEVDLDKLAVVEKIKVLLKQGAMQFIYNLTQTHINTHTHILICAVVESRR